MSEPAISWAHGADAFQAPEALGAVQRIALVVGSVGFVGCVFGFFNNRQQFFQSYLVGYLFWLMIALGCLAWTMIQHLAGGGWGLAARRIMEAGTRTLPLLIVLFLPFFFGMSDLYVWADPDVVAQDELIQGKEAYLNVGAFWMRAVLYFALWSGLAFLLNRYSMRQDQTGDPAIAARLRTISGPGLVIYMLTCSFASYDWLMSLDPHWFSSIYGLAFVIGTGLSALCVITITAVYLWRREPMNHVFQAKHLHDYGKFSLALVMIWAYFALSQFLITWSGNVPEFVTWYVHRNQLGWKAYSVVVVILHFFVPFLLLLSRDLKRNPGLMATIALYLLGARWLDLYWQVAPTFHEHITIHALDFATVIAVGGLWVALFVAELKKRPLLPINAPRTQELLSHE